MTARSAPPNMSAPSAHIALIVPASNTVMEPDFHRHADANWNISTWRIFLEDVTREAEVRMLRDELPRTVRHIATTTPDLVVFGCTSAGSLDGLAHDRAVAEQIGKETGSAVITVVDAMVEHLRALSPMRVAVFTPYRPELTQSVAGCVAEAGYEVVAAKGMDLVDNREIGRRTPDEIVAFVRSNIAGTDADCVFLSCTNWRAMDAIEPLERELGLPVLSSNHVTLESVRRFLAGIAATEPAVEGTTLS